MRKFGMGITALITVAALTGCSSTGTSAESPDAPDVEVSVEASLEGQTITLVVPFDPGGGYDAYARLLAPALGEELGATVIVENRPGAGGILATNEVVNAEPDGTTIVLLNGPGHLGSAIAETDGVQYDAEQMSYIGQISSEPDVVVTNTSSMIESVEDMAGKRFSATGPGSNEFIDAVVLDVLLGLDSEVITGFASSNEANLSVVQGDVDLHSRSLGSQLPGIAAGDLVPVLVIGTNTGEAEIANVPNLVDVVPAESRELATLHSGLVSSGRIIAGPPGMEEGVLTLLRNAFEAVVTDEAFQEAAAEAGRPISFMNGPDVQQLVSDVIGSPAAYVDLIKRAYGG